MQCRRSFFCSFPVFFAVFFFAHRFAFLSCSLPRSSPTPHFLCSICDLPHTIARGPLPIFAEGASSPEIPALFLCHAAPSLPPSPSSLPPPPPACTAFSNVRSCRLFAARPTVRSVPFGDRSVALDGSLSNVPRITRPLPSRVVFLFLPPIPPLTHQLSSRRRPSLACLRRPESGPFVRLPSTLFFFPARSPKAAPPRRSPRAFFPACPTGRCHSAASPLPPSPPPRPLPPPLFQRANAPSLSGV